jgi:hypothetical protein
MADDAASLKTYAEARIRILEMDASIWEREVEACQRKVSSAQAAPYHHTAAVDHEQQRLRQAQANLNEIRRRQAALRYGQFRTKADIDAI